MLNIILTSILSCLITILLIPNWIKVCQQWTLFESTDDRKRHKQKIPTMGGISIFAGIFISFILFGTTSDLLEMKYIIVASIILFFTGFFDDLIDISAIKKLLIQIGVSVLIGLGGMRISSFYGLLGIEEIPIWMQYLTTVMFIVLITNAYNLIDGIDGLAGSLGMLSAMIFGVIFISNDHLNLAVLSFSLAGALLGFLTYNFNPAKIFMGDTGSLIVGFLLSVLAINCLNLNNAYSGAYVASPSLVIAILFVPVYDVLRVSMIRIITGYSPFRADRNHVHHMIMKQGFGQRVTTMIILVINIFLILLSIPFTHLNINLYIILNTCIGMLCINTLVMSQLANIWGKLGGKLYNKRTLAS